MPHKIYLAGSCSIENRTIMKEVATALRKKAYDVYFPLENEVENAWNMSQEEWSSVVFENDVNAINNCDTFLMISHGRNSTAGTNWEQGYAYAKGKTVIVVQITLEPTSLMTYNGCHVFVHANIKNVSESVLCALTIARQNEKTGYKNVHKNCATVLT